MAEENLPKELTPCPSPWPGMKADVFCSLAWSKGLPPGSYGPLEEQAGFADPERNGRHTSGPGMVMIVRYTTTPVGKVSRIAPDQGMDG